MKLGIVDLDTSHAAAWLPLERELGWEIAGVWDGGSVHPAGYAQRFARDHGVPRVFDRLADMVPEVDAVVLHGCDWSQRIEKARPFVEAGRAVLVDKPLAGDPDGLRQLERWFSKGARIFGGSSLRFAPELEDWLGRPEAERGTPTMALFGEAADEFFLGVHLFTFACAVMGPGLRSARSLGNREERRVELRWNDAKVASISFARTHPNERPFQATVFTTRGSVSIQPDPALLYRAFLQRVSPWLAGKTDVPPCPFAELIEPEMGAFAAKLSDQRGGTWVELDEVPPYYGFDGSAFAAAYRRQGYGGFAS